MFKTDSFLGNKKLSLNQNCWRDHATMQGLLDRWTSQLDLGITTGCLEREVSVHNST